jgi:hypothetical protein
MPDTVHEYLNMSTRWILRQKWNVSDKCRENLVHAVIRVPCKWMWRSWLPTCSADHICGIRLDRTAIGMLQWNCAQKSFPKLIQARGYFNNKYTSCLLVPVAVRFGAKDLAAGCWDRGFDSRFGPFRQWLSWNDIPDKASLCPPWGSARLPSRLPATF